MIKKYIVLIFLLSLVPISLHAATYNWYFNNTSGDDGDGNGTITNPWQTASKARTQINTLSSSDILYIYFNKGDTFSFSSTDGNAYFLIDFDEAHFDAYGSGANPILDGGVDFSAGDPLTGSRNRWDPIIQFYTNSTGSTVQNIDFENHHGAAISNGGDYSNITVEYCNFSDIGMHAVSLGPSNCTIQYCNADLCQRLEEYDYVDGMWGAAFAFRGEGQDNLIQYCIVSRTYGEGIYLESGGTAYRNVVAITYSVGVYVVPHNTTPTGGFIIRQNIIWGYKNATVPGTVKNFRGNDNGIGICDETAGGSNNVTVDIDGNIVIHRRWGMRIYDLDGSAVWGAVTIVNNTVIDSYLNNYEFESPDRFSTVKFHRNASIFYDISSTYLDEGHVYSSISSDPDYSISYNSYYPVNGTFPVDADWDDNYVTSDPTLTATSGWTTPPGDGGLMSHDTTTFDFSNLIPQVGSALYDSGDSPTGSESAEFLISGTDVSGSVLSPGDFATSNINGDGLPDIGAIVEYMNYIFGPGVTMGSGVSFQ